MNTLAPTPADIQSHLYTAFLQGKTSDVALCVRGTWSAVYRLHRVVLIQSGFFQSLFTAGFLESSSNKRSSKYGSDIIDIVFDDRNITRAAFEVCIARLYGGGPPLHVPTCLTPTAAHPLTPSFPTLSEPEPVPPNHHPATPRFLLSLLATSIYLSIPSVATQALSLILNTVGPNTVLQYLNFALGRPLAPPDFLLGEPHAAVGLENIAQALDEGEECLSPASDTCKSESEEFSDILSGLRIKEDARQPDSPTSFDSSDTSDGAGQDDNAVCHYGAVSNKIGEASACWLARWATDVIAHEAGQQQETPTVSRKRSGMALADLPPTDSVRLSFSTRLSPSFTIWNRGGLSARWIAALVSSDTLFVKNERHRYDFARTVVEMRRAKGILPEEEQEWSTMFETGIYYANMSMDDIIIISNDTSPTTKQPFVPLHILQAAHWSQSVLRHTIVSRPPSTSSPQPASISPKDKELGITLTTAELLPQITCANTPGTLSPEATKAYFPVPTDSSFRVGDNGTAFNSSVEGTPVSMDELFKFTDSPNIPTSHASNGRTVHRSNNAQVFPLITSESTYFGLLTSRQTSSGCTSVDASGKSQWSPHPPYRFSVEFWNLETLREKNRLYSNTIWYAGSLFNVYIQIIRKKGQAQLGIYLHRQSSIDPIPPPSTPVPPPCALDGRENETAAGRNGERHYRGGSSQSIGTPGSPLHFSPSIHPLVHQTGSILSSSTARSSSPIISGSGSGSGSPSSPGGLTSAFGGGFTNRGLAPSQPYRDPRSMIAAYFTISCASATGSSQTRFSSAPDVFSISQSWGWKSSSLRTEEYMDIGIDEDGEGSVPPQARTKPHSREVSFRATVLLGLV